MSFAAEIALKSDSCSLAFTGSNRRSHKLIYQFCSGVKVHIYWSKTFINKYLLSSVPVGVPLKRLREQKKLDEESVYLQYVRDDVFLTLFEKRVFVKGGVRLHDLRQHLGHFRLREETA